jgi:hypothetical protein
MKQQKAACSRQAAEHVRLGGFAQVRVQGLDPPAPTHNDCTCA